MSTRNQLALALGWFVLIDILLTTSTGVAGNMINLALSLRGVFRGLTSSFIYNFATNILVLISIISIALIIFLLIAWISTIQLTRVLVSFFFLDKQSAPEDQQVREQKMLQTLFGKNFMSSKVSLFWRTLFSIVIIWMLLLIVIMLSGVVFSFSNY